MDTVLRLPCQQPCGPPPRLSGSISDDDRYRPSVAIVGGLRLLLSACGHGVLPYCPSIPLPPPILPRTGAGTRLERGTLLVPAAWACGVSARPPASSCGGGTHPSASRAPHVPVW